MAASTRQQEKSLDEILSEQKQVLYASVGQIVSELFYTRRYKSFGYSRGEVLHYKLGFVNSNKFCRYVELGDYYIRLCGVPDRISYEDGKMYVDELKTTITNREGIVRKVGLAQLQLYMLITGIQYGRLFIYYKDREELVLDKELEYDENIARQILLRYIEVYNARRRAKQIVV